MSAAFRIALIAMGLAAVQVTARAADFPKYTGFVNDYTNLLTAETRAQLETLLRATEADTTAEIAVAIVPSLDGMSVEEYANRLFKEWGVGKETVDNGVLVVVAPAQREMRIEVGYGLEPILPDGLAGEIIRTNFLPHFRDDRYAEGITEGVTRLVDVVRANHVLTAEELAALEDSGRNDVPKWVTIPFFGLFVGIGFFMAGVGIGSKTGFPLMFGSLFGGMPFLMSLLFSASVYVLGPLAIGVFVYGFVVGRRRPAWVRDLRTSGGGAGSGWVMGGNSSGGGGSSSGSSGGGSFGGGSSGGGGASGRW